MYLQGIKRDPQNHNCQCMCRRSQVNIMFLYIYVYILIKLVYIMTPVWTLLNSNYNFLITQLYISEFQEKVCKK